MKIEKRSLPVLELIFSQILSEDQKKRSSLVLNLFS